MSDEHPSAPSTPAPGTALYVTASPDDPYATRPQLSPGAPTPVDVGDSPPATVDRPLPCVPGYELLGVLGRGGMGIVYKARQGPPLNRTVALKMVLGGGHAGTEEHARFLTEAESVAALEHPGIVQVFEFGTHDGLPYFALEFCPGGTLSERLAGTPLPPREAAVLVAKLACAVEHAHQRGLVHRDLKPANVLLTAAGEPKVTDFGLVKRVDGGDSLTQTGQVMGTPSYMAPEQAQGKKAVGPLADVYSLGAILYESLTGRPPFKAATPFETMQQVIHEEPVSPSQLNMQVPGDLETVCLTCLHKYPEKRYASAQDLADELRRFLSGEPVRARRIGLARRFGRWCKSRPGLTVIIFLLVLLSQTVAVVYFSDRQFKAEIRRSRFEQLFQIAHTARNQADHYLRANQLAMSLLSRMPEVRDTLRPGFRGRTDTTKAIAAFLDAELEKQRDVSGYAVVDLTGTPVFSTIGGLGRPDLTILDHPAGISDNCVVSDTFFLNTRSSPEAIPVIAIAHNVSSVNGITLGRFVSFIKPTGLLRPLLDSAFRDDSEMYFQRPASRSKVGAILQPFRLAYGGKYTDDSVVRACIIDQHGIVTSCNDRCWLYHPAGPLSRDEIDLLVSQQRFGKDTEAWMHEAIGYHDLFQLVRRDSHWDGDSAYEAKIHGATFYGGPSLGVVRRLEVVPWSLFIEFDEKVLSTATEDAVWVLLACCVPFMTIVVYLGALWLHEITRNSTTWHSSGIDSGSTKPSRS